VLFNLTIRLGSTSEKFLNVTVTDNARLIDRVLKAESSLVELILPGDEPKVEKTKAAVVAYKELLAAPNDAARVDLDDAATKAEKELAIASEELAVAVKELAAAY
jgi:hypothetical protein